MKAIKILAVILVLFWSFGAQVSADQSSLVTGDWCFYEQEGYGQTIPEKVEITFNENGTYDWFEPPKFRQKGTWQLSEDELIMSDVGSHKILKLNQNEMELERGSLMRFNKGKCDTKSFSDQDITAFHNGASTGDLKTINDYINRGIDINITDLFRGDTALIKAGQFCQVEAAKILIDKGADKNIKDERGKKPLDYAKSSDYHEGCNELVKLLQ